MQRPRCSGEAARTILPRSAQQVFAHASVELYSRSIAVLLGCSHRSVLVSPSPCWMTNRRCILSFLEAVLYIYISLGWTMYRQGNRSLRTREVFYVLGKMIWKNARAVRKWHHLALYRRVFDPLSNVLQVQSHDTLMTPFSCIVSESKSKFTQLFQSRPAFAGHQ